MIRITMFCKDRNLPPTFPSVENDFIQ